jgi:hypothetical protein
MKSPIGRKGVGEWSDILVAVLLAACLFLAALRIPEIIGDVIDLLALASAEKTARDLGGIITVSAAATDTITIYHSTESEQIFYDIKIEDRIVHITDISSSGSGLGSASATMKSGWGKIGVGDISKELAYKNYFTIQKERITEEDTVKDVFDIV